MEAVCDTAAYSGQLPLLQWARAQTPPFPWDETTSMAAAVNGHAEMLQWARAQDPPCPWDESTTRAAVEGHHLSLLQWLLAQTPPAPGNPIALGQLAFLRGHWDIVQWILEHYHLRPQSSWQLDVPPEPWTTENYRTECYYHRQALASRHGVQWTTKITAWLNAVDAVCQCSMLCPDLVALVQRYC